MPLFHTLMKRSAFGIIAVVLSIGLSLTTVMAKDITIQVWAGGSNINDSYRVDAISMAGRLPRMQIAPVKCILIKVYILMIVLLNWLKQ